MALTYDGVTLRLYVNGTQVATRATTGTIQTTDNPLWIGGNSPYGEYFQGLIDEVRVYNRALTQADIQSDMNTSIVPTRPGHDPAVGAVRARRDRDRVQPDQPELDRVDRQRRREPATASSAVRARAAPTSPRWQPTGDFFNDTGLAPSTIYRYRVRAADAGRQPEPLLHDRHRDHPRRDRYDPAVGAHRAHRDRGRHGPDRPDLDRRDRQRRRHRLPRRALPGRQLHQLRPGRARPTTTSYSDTGLSSTTTYRYHVRAVDASNNLSAYSSITTATTHAAADTTPPSAPTGLTAHRASTTRIDLTWTASTDNVGVTGYRVERCQGNNCTNFAQVGTPTTTNLSDTGLPANTIYRFRVRAADAAGNLSAYSAIVTAERSPPTPPADGSYRAHRHRGEYDPDRPELDGLHRQRRRHRLPRRALPGRGMHQLRRDRARRPRPPTTTPACCRRPPTATGSVPSTPRATSASTRPSPP